MTGEMMSDSSCLGKKNNFLAYSILREFLHEWQVQAKTILQGIVHWLAYKSSGHFWHCFHSNHAVDHVLWPFFYFIDLFFKLFQPFKQCGSTMRQLIIHSSPESALFAILSCFILVYLIPGSNGTELISFNPL